MRIKKSDIRKADFSDASMLNFLMRQCFLDVAHKFGFNAENYPQHPSNSTIEIVQKHLSNGISFLIKIDRGIPSGCIGLKYISEDFCEVIQLGVLPGRRRRGFGSELLKAAILEAKESKVKHIGATIIAEDIELKQWLEKFGFNETQAVDIKDFPFRALLMKLSI